MVASAAALTAGLRRGRKSKGERAVSKTSEGPSKFQWLADILRQQQVRTLYQNATVQWEATGQRQAAQQRETIVKWEATGQREATGGNDAMGQQQERNMSTLFKQRV